jgi:hypothetical protein
MKSNSYEVSLEIAINWFNADGKRMCNFFVCDNSPRELIKHLNKAIEEIQNRKRPNIMDVSSMKQYLYAYKCCIAIIEDYERRQQEIVDAINGMMIEFNKIKR